MIPFDDALSICHFNDDELIAYLEEIGDEEAARALTMSGARGQGFARMRGAAYACAAHVYGFIEAGDSPSERLKIVPASSVTADQNLLGHPIKVTLDAFRVQEYPGTGLHTVLFDFQGRDQAGSEEQDLQFASVLQVHDHDNAAVSGVPIFTGLTVPRDGLSFKARTISIRSSGDETILRVLQSSLFKDGLRLLGQVQPALPQLVGLAGGITENLLKRRWNKQVQLFDLGLDFGMSRTSSRLRLGSYVAVQVPDPNLWNWDNWFYDPNSMNIVNSDGHIAPNNTVVFAISESGSTMPRSAMREEGRNAAAVSGKNTA